MSSPILDYQPPSGMPQYGAPGLPIPGLLVYWPSVNSLTDSSADASVQNIVSLDQQPIYKLPSSAVIEVSITGRGGSQWKRTQDASSPATDLNGGIIQPVDYDPDARPFILLRIAGF